MLRVSQFTLLLIWTLTVTGCAAIITGKNQTMTIESSPSEARCELSRQGRVIGSVEKTPGALMVERTKYDIDVMCHKDGFGDSKAFADSGLEPWVFGNIVLGGLIGWGIDSAVGADNKYPEVVSVNMGAAPNSSVQTYSKVTTSTSDTQSEATRQRLKEIENLHSEGLLTDSEYKAKRAKVIGGL